MGFTTVMRKAFPFLAAGASLGGPLGTMAATIVGKAIGADKAPASTADSIANAIAGAMVDPAQRAALLKAEQDFQLQMAELGFKNVEDLEQIAASDRASARNMQIQTRSRIPGMLAVAVLVMCVAGDGYYLMHGTPKGASPELVGRILAGLENAVMLVLAYYFGSSAGSDRKTELLAEAPPVSK